MTTTSPDQAGPGSAEQAAKSYPRTVLGYVKAWFHALRVALNRPLAAYYLLLTSTALLLTIGLIMVLSASSVWSYQYMDNSYAIVGRQVLWVMIGIPCAFIASRIRPRHLRRLAWPAYIFACVLLFLTIFLGHSVNGQQNWLGVGPVKIQPSEIAKLSLVLWAAHVYALKERRLDSLHEVLMPVVPGMALAVGLVLAGQDLGTALVFFAVMLGMLWVVGAPGKLFGIAISVIGVSVLFLISTNTERLGRLTSFVDPFKDFHGAGWQPSHGLYALSSGGLLGQGIGASQQKWGDLPEAHTDYIFAVLGEELGLVGTLLVVGLFLTLAFALIKVARQTDRPFVRYFSFGVLVWLLGQMIINVGMVLALLPVIGIPLPLVSYGGSALIPSMVALGVVIGFARREPAAAAALAHRKALAKDHARQAAAYRRGQRTR
ncbi:MAG: putative lipid II flippase FtsW [Nocardioides sp.]|uniref:putative lipid II flippase FtsW n=1 Tax=Nocardioides sp. TaxID=35761 RepID=UPI003D6B2A1E